MTARRLVGRLQRRRKPGWRVIVLEECHARLFPTRAPQWVKRGHYAEIPLYDRHGKGMIFGAVDLHSGRKFHHVADSLSGAEQLVLLEQVVAAYPEERVPLVWEHGPTHRNRQVQEWLAQPPQVVCFGLPP